MRRSATDKGRTAFHCSCTGTTNHFVDPVILFGLLCGNRCLCSQLHFLGVYNLMPPPVTALHLWTITELIQTLLSIGLELARRFRISLPPVPPQDDTIPFHGTETCHWCTCTCVRTAPVHRTHQCHRHLGF